MTSLQIAAAATAWAGIGIWLYWSMWFWYLAAHHEFEDEKNRIKYGTYDVIRKQRRGFKISGVILALAVALYGLSFL